MAAVSSKLVDVFIKTFQLRDEGQDQRYQFQLMKQIKETGFVTEALAAHLDQLDGKPNDGFTRKEIELFLATEGLKGLSRFYPLRDFFWNPRSSRIEVGKASRDDRKLVTHDSPQVQQILRVAGLPQNVLKNMNVMAVQYVPGKPIILVHEDDSHGDAEIELIKRDVSHQFMQSPLSAHPVFIELPGAPEMIPSKENDWKAIQTILRDDELMSLSVDDPNFGDKVVRIAGGIGATQLMHRLPALQALKKALGHTPISYAEMKKRYGKEKVIRELLDQMDATFAFEFLYGDRAVLLNVESAHPLIVKKKSEHERINTPVPDEARAANTRFNHAIVDLGVQPSAQDYAVINQSADKRTKRWAERLVGFPKDNPELFPKGKPAVIFFSGGSAHMPLLTEELKKAGDSYLFLRKKPSDV